MKKIACLSFLAGTAMLATEAQAVPNRIYVGLDYAVHQNSVDDNGPTFRSVNPNINYATEYPEDFQADFYKRNIPHQFLTRKEKYVLRQEKRQFLNLPQKRRQSARAARR